MPQKLSTYRYMQLRVTILIEQPICAICKKNSAKEIDHRLPKALGGTDDRNNLQSVCRPCHKIKTIKDMELMSILKLPPSCEEIPLSFDEYLRLKKEGVKFKCIYSRKTGWWEVVRKHAS